MIFLWSGPQYFGLFIVSFRTKFNKMNITKYKSISFVIEPGLTCKSVLVTAWISFNSFSLTLTKWFYCNNWWRLILNYNVDLLFFFFYYFVQWNSFTWNETFINLFCFREKEREIEKEKVNLWSFWIKLNSNISRK